MVTLDLEEEDGNNETKGFLDSRTWVREKRRRRRSEGEGEGEGVV